MTEQPITVSVIDHVADVRLNRPEQRNAIDGTMMRAAADAAADIAADPSIRVVVLSGEGKSFCSGLDMSNFADMASGDLAGDSAAVQAAAADLSPGGAAFPQQVSWAWYELPQPVIAAVHGAAFGAGIHVMLGADIRYIAPDTRLAFVETNWGLIPDLSGTQGMRRGVRLDVAKELVMTSREFSGAEAVDLGFATRSTETPFDDAMETARTIAAKSPAAIRAAKRLLNESALRTVAAGLALELELSTTLLGTDEQLEAVMARLESRPAAFD
jgi:enoyl-CoA hydratase/carnithine racemase